ncbi:TRAPP subunit [Yamadazyma tenuis]|uniref:Transport protein particle 20 kDa subunit n=1 Tax=Candida tenuis (strain ATCC 10573 / BCRC 21748 / CBS 615 / JCM 9827 / NBRC 10315 / NRRL Y-1498 / VKM Y-70) TaxID=590646 RepID=G3B3I1_CANTC|nr:transport protein particle 20 kDa subunit [Yamadazyma tenuis ATCC 10573]EGV64166.1 transport protein particle 20 kDa subunit [Yamadazyma tenuis ATCC 10573]WEJ96184.1 TRAPP subunit [Yamadazyma tenuis]
MSSYYFTIIGTNDTPLYELEFASFKLGGSGASQVPGKSQFSNNVKEILPFVTHSSIDLIEDVQWNNNQFYLGKVDSFYGLSVNAFVTQGNIKFIICYDNGNGRYDENAIRQFFMETNELYVKELMDPFYSVNDALTSPDFDLRIKLLAKKYL